MEKIININNNRIFKLHINRDYTRLAEIVMLNDTDFVDYGLSQSDDYGFDAFDSLNRNTESLSFEFDVDHPLYFPLLHLLNGDKILLIDDDETAQLNKKYMSLTNEEGKIVLKFVNKKEKAHGPEKFTVFVKNVAFDLRSKIDDQRLDTKERLYKFFNETRTVIQEEYHQISIEEYIYKKELKMSYEKKSN